MQRNWAKLIKKQELTQGFSEREFGELTSMMEIRHYKQGQTIIEEGERISTIHFILQGEIEVLKYDEKRENLFTILSLKEGSFFGEMSFVDNKPTSASIRAGTNCVTWVILKKKVEQLHLYDKLIRNIAVCEIKRLRATNKDYVKSLESQLKESRLRNDFGRFFIVTIILFCIFDFIPNTTSASPIEQLLYSWGFLGIILIPIVYFVKRIVHPVSTFGITTAGWKKALREGILISLFLILALALYKYITTPDEPLITWRYKSQYSPTDFYIYFSLYMFHSFIQEFIARGVIQGSLQRFMSGSHYMTPILIASLMFGISHLHISFFTSLITFIAGVSFGYIYYRHGNLIGVTMMHYVMGVTTMALGYI